MTPGTAACISPKVVRGHFVQLLKQKLAKDLQVICSRGQDNEVSTLSQRSRIGEMNHL
jgi:hypothetical protein